MSAIKSISAAMDTMQLEIEGLRERLDRAVERNFLLEELLMESGYRRIHQIDTANGPLPDDIRAEAGDMALVLTVEARHPEGLEVSVNECRAGEIVVTKDAASRAEAILADARGMLRADLGRDEIRAILEAELGSAVRRQQSLLT